ncbi:UNVERIFIED_CONTAM: hypothetical protein FKN15_005877 [Acipenser sinensis]
MATSSTNRVYQLVIFGASGFTGQFVVEEVARNTAEGPKGTLKWALAGRNRQKLQEVLDQAAENLGKPELKSEVDIIIADVGEPDSLASMSKQASIVLNCVGPYRFFGEPVVKACVENGAHCIDISGEPQFLEGMQLNYNSQAAKNGVYVIGSCGFDSIPADMGVLYTRDQFKGTLTAIESFLSVNTGPEVQYSAFAAVGGVCSVIKLMFAVMLFWLFVLTSFGRNLLIKMEGCSFSMTFFGQGYSQGQDPQEGKPNLKICTQVKGPGTNSVLSLNLCHASVSGYYGMGGVYTPGAAFCKTSLIERLNKHGVVFSVISKPEV